MKPIFIFILCALAVSCSVSDDFILRDPEAAQLVFPLNNQECTQGIAIPGTNTTEVTFSWEASKYTDYYTVVLRNLVKGTENSFNATATELSIALEKATPYSWYVLSHNTAIELPSQSATWYLYNAGNPVTSFAPFPAEVVYPEMAATYEGLSSIQLEWNGLDIDNDIVSYDVYFGTDNPATTLVASQSQNILQVDLVPDTVYYWSVLTIDSAGNTSQSEVFQFKNE